MLTNTCVAVTIINRPNRCPERFWERGKSMINHEQEMTESQLEEFMTLRLINNLEIFFNILPDKVPSVVSEQMSIVRDLLSKRGIKRLEQKNLEETDQACN